MTLPRRANVLSKDASGKQVEILSSSKQQEHLRPFLSKDSAPLLPRRPPLIFLLSGIFLIFATVALLFQGWLEQGLHFDEVFRENKLIEMAEPTASRIGAHSLFSIDVGETKLPVMYKSYISSTSILIKSPFLLFQDYHLGIRILEAGYFFLAVAGFFLIASRIHPTAGLAVSLMVATNPLFYPEIRYGMSFAFHVFLIPCALYLIYRHFRVSRRLSQLFLAALLLGLAVNIKFYSFWLVAALGISLCVFYPREILEVLKDIRRIAVVLLGVFLGGINYVLYNVLGAGATFQPLYDRIFYSSEVEPIEYEAQRTFLEWLDIKLGLLTSFLGPYSSWYLLLIAIIMICYLVILVKVLRQGTWKQWRIYFLAPAVLLLTCAFILISPRTTRAGHYVYLSPALDLTLALGVILIARVALSLKAAGDFLIAIVLFGILTFNVVSTTPKIADALQEKASHHPSSAIFQLHHYLDEEGILPGQTIHIQWGMYSQLYFLNRGNYEIRSLVFQLMRADSKAERNHVLTTFFLSESNKGGPLYFPVHAGDDVIRHDLEDFVQGLGGQLEVMAQFSGRRDEPVIILLRMKDSGWLVAALRERVQKLPVSPALKVFQCGPQPFDFGGQEFLYVWCKTEGHSRGTRLSFGAHLMNTGYHQDYLTGTLWKNWVEGSEDWIRLVDLENNVKSEAIPVRIR